MMRTAWIAALGWLTVAVGPALAQTPSLEDNREIAAMFEADQAIRNAIDPAKLPDMTVIRRMIAEDAARRTRAEAMLREGSLNTAEDYYRAAFIFQHGSKSADYLLAHSLAMAAVARGKTEANWIAAATLDRYLMQIGQPQIYGTQYSRSREAGPTMDPYDRSLIPDSVRTALGVPVQAEQFKKLDAMKASVPKP
ncbi:DUF6624 domain-containing protein [Sphingomonas pseudosanguinis]|uniref:DUF6624 domain-containing protein n=1 Tax=Sphingomonas pseudosanguinis TaxID=413712 RepID=UPI003F876DA8